MSKLLIPQETFNISLSDTESVEIGLAEPDLRADNLTLTTWTSSFVLASQLHKLHGSIQFPKDDTHTKKSTEACGKGLVAQDEIPILEIGAGTALVGMTASLIWSKPAVLTDLPGIVPGLEQNVNLNLPHFLQKDMLTRLPRCGILDWTTPETLTLSTAGSDPNSSSKKHSPSTYSSTTTKAQLILAADTVYDENHPLLIANVIDTWLSRTATARAVVCYALRVAYLEQVRELWELLETRGMEAEVHGQERAEDEGNAMWDDECLCEWVVWRWKDDGRLNNGVGE